MHFSSSGDEVGKDRGRKDGRGQGVVLAPRTSITRADSVVRSSSSLGVEKSHFDVGATARLTPTLRSWHPVLHDRGMTTYSAGGLPLPSPFHPACRDRWDYRDAQRDFISRAIAPPPRRRASFIVDKLITRNKSGRHTEQVIDPREWGGSGITPRCRRSNCR